MLPNDRIRCYVRMEHETAVAEIRRSDAISLARGARLLCSSVTAHVTATVRTMNWTLLKL